MFKVFKQEGVNIKLGRGFIYTEKSAGCGVQLDFGEKYIISGKQPFF